MATAPKERIVAVRADQLVGHVPVAEYHPDAGVPLTAGNSRQVGEALGREFGEEPRARLAENGLSPQLEQLEVEPRALVGSGHQSVQYVIVRRTEGYVAEVGDAARRCCG